MLSELHLGEVALPDGLEQPESKYFYIVETIKQNKS